MYSHEDKMRAVEPYLRYDRSAAAVINEFGYPSRQTLRLWYMEFAENRSLSRGRHRRYDNLQKRAAVDHFFDHGQCLARTLRQLARSSHYKTAPFGDDSRDALLEREGHSCFILWRRFPAGRSVRALMRRQEADRIPSTQSAGFHPGSRMAIIAQA